MKSKLKIISCLIVMAILLIGLVGCNEGSSSDTSSSNNDEVENIAPTADAGGSYSGTTGETISLSGSGSTDSDGTITAYAWDLDNDGQYDDASGAAADFTSSSAGTFTVGLQVTDDAGATGTDTALVTVSEQAQEGPFTGYNLFAPLNSTMTYLMDNDGNFVHSWETGYRPGNSVYLLENGELLHTGNVVNSSFNAGGAGGIVQTLDWESNVTWEYEYSDTTHLQHHDVEMLPSGNVLMIAWETKTEAEAVAAGRDPSLLNDGKLWPDSVIEVAPTGSNTGRIVWEWHTWDHLVQDYDATRSNYGVVADHPERINLNYVMRNGTADWTHVNAVDYNEELDQILLTVHNLSEVWVIDHSTTPAEAAGHSGGNSGKGGDLLYRWGNPQTYDAGHTDDQQLFGPHDGEWIESGCPGEGDILIFNNGIQRPDGNYSSVDEIAPPVSADGSYSFAADSAYDPDTPVWTYMADPPTDFYAQNISSAQRLPNGNTLICDGPGGYFFEIAESGETVWEYNTTGEVFRIKRYAPDYSGFDGTSLDDEAASLAPVADAGGPYTGKTGAAISLSGSGSTDSDGWITAYAWDLDNDGQYDDANGVTADFSSASAGTYTIGLLVADNDGMTDTETTTVTISNSETGTVTYPVVDTGQTACYNNTNSISAPAPDDSFYGQDAQYNGNQPSYAVSADGPTVYDNVTGLTWMQTADLDEDGDIDADDKLTYDEAQDYPDTLNAMNYGGYSDWRVPTIKELYSLIDFRGTDPRIDYNSNSGSGLTPFIDTGIFAFAYGDTNAGERNIDSQWVTRTLYAGKVFGNMQAMFGVNFADGRIKGYPTESGPGGAAKTYFVRLCRGNTNYGINDFVDNGDGTITDHATGLMWTQDDSGVGMNWEDTLAWAEQKNSENYLGQNDWRLPNAKELQSIVDYSRSPDATNSAAVDPLFKATQITNEAGDADYPFYWTGTTHIRQGGIGSAGVYVAFGRGMGTMDGVNAIDVHGAGCQRSDPKDGDPDDYPSLGNGPQGDVQRVFNYVRLVRDADAEK